MVNRIPKHRTTIKKTGGFQETFIIIFGFGLRFSAKEFIDDQVLITGSHNYTKAVEYQNAGNILIIRQPQLANLHPGLEQSLERGFLD